MAIPNALSFVCTPSSLVASSPCLQCLSEKELWAVIVAILALGAGKTLPQAVEDGACFNCMSRKQMLQALVTLLGNDILGESISAQTVIDQMHCLVCAPESQLMAAALKLWCDNYTFTLDQNR